MNNFQISVEADGAIAMFDRIIAFAEDKNPLVESARAAEDRIKKTFTDRTDPWGAQWPVLSSVTLHLRQRRGNFSDAPLMDSQDMFRSIQTAQDSEGIFITVWDAAAFPATHQYGNPSNRAWGRSNAPIPQRAFFPMREEDKLEIPDEWLSDMYLPLDEGLKKAIQ